jgi:hypothetical protein
MTTTTESKTLGELLKEKELFRQKNVEALKNEFKEWFVNKARSTIIKNMIEDYESIAFDMDQPKFSPLLSLYKNIFMELLSEIMKEQQVIIRFQQTLNRHCSHHHDSICDMCFTGFRIDKSDPL